MKEEIKAPVVPEFKEKSFEELDKMTDKERFEYRAKEQEYLGKKSELDLYNAIQEVKAEKDAENKEKLDAMKATLEALTKENIKFGLEIKSLTERPANFGEASESMKNISESMKAIKALSPTATGDDAEVEIKMSDINAVTKADTLTTSISGNTQAQDDPGIGQLNSRRVTMYGLFPKITMGTNNNGTVRYWDWDDATSVRAAEMRAEGAAFPESTAKWEENTKTLKKVGDTLPVSAEFFEDEAMFAAELRMFLITNVELIVDYQICYGAGTGNNITGLFTYADAFTPASVTHVSDPTIYDLVCVMHEQATKSKGKFNPDFVIMNTSTVNKMQLSKDANENYIMPPFVSRDGSTIKGIRVVTADVVNDDEMLLGDSRFARIYEKPGITVSRGWKADQFVEDMETLKVRKRLLLLIKERDRAGFIKVTDIDAALAAIDATS